MGRKYKLQNNSKGLAFSQRQSNEDTFVLTQTEILCLLMRMCIGLSQSQYQAHPFIYRVVEICVIAASVLRCRYSLIKKKLSRQRPNTRLRLHTAFIKIQVLSMFDEILSQLYWL